MTGPGHDDQGTSPRRGLSAGPIRRGTVARLAIRTVRAAQLLAWQLIEVLLALVILFEEWGWRPLSAALARLARIEIIGRLERAVVTLPPWPALAVFLVPSVLFLPLKLASLWLIAKGQVLAATVLFALAKVAGTALYARIFQLTQPALMRLAWFARAYNWFMPWKEAILEHARATRAWRAAMEIKARAKTLARDLWRRVRPAVLAIAARLRALFVR